MSEHRGLAIQSTREPGYWDQILDCGHTPTRGDAGTALEALGTGYGVYRGAGGTGIEDGSTACYACCAARTRADMVATGKATLYLVRGDARKGTPWEVTDWPGQLRFPVYGVGRGRHNIARVRYDFWFKVDGATWHGVQYGDWTQIAHCRRTKM